MISLSGHLENLVDKSGALTLGDVLTGPSANRFEHLPGFVNHGYLAGASWTRFSYTTPAGGPAEWYLRLVPAFLDDVRVYVQEGPDPSIPASYREYQLGDHFPMADRRVRHTDMVAPAPAAVAAPRTVYIRVSTTSTHNLQGWLYTPDDLIAWSGTYTLLIGLMLGIFLVVVMVNAFYAVVARSALFAWYSLFILGNFLRQLGIDGALLALWPEGAHQVNDWLVGGGVGLGLSAYSLFAMSLFTTREQWPRTHRFLQANVIIGALTAICIPFGWYGRLAPVMVISFLLLSCYAPVLAVAYARRRGPGSRLLVFGFVVAMFPVIPRLLSVLALIPSTWLTTNSYIFGVLAQAVVMTMALVQRLHVTREQLLSVTLQAEARAVELAEERTRELSANKHTLEAALEERQRAFNQQEKFVAMISHEYRTPLAIVSGNLHLLEQYGAADSRQAAPLAKMKRAVARLLEIFDRSLEQTHLGEAPYNLVFQPVALTELLAEVVADAGREWPERLITFDQGIPPKTLIQGDRALLRTALWNLLGNAVKYSPPTTAIELRGATDPDGIILDIIDQGPGIPCADREQIFAKYHRGAASAGTSGTGIGLWLVRWIIEEHGGSVTLADNEPHGTIVRIVLSKE